MGDDLAADCARCVGLCCVALPFGRSADFAFAKSAGSPCRHLATDHRCQIHATLAEHGMRGCTTFDCFGAGQKVTQVTFGGASWRDDGALAAPMFAAFATMRQLHELLVHLTQALAMAGTDQALCHEVRALHRRIEDETRSPTVATVDTDELRRAAGPLLARASATARAGLDGPSHRGADLMGHRLRGAELRGADLRGSLLVGADLRGADLRAADLLGADLRGADVRSADLRGALFLTGPQAAAARGDASTLLTIDRPATWRTPPGGTSATMA